MVLNNYIQQQERTECQRGRTMLLSTTFGACWACQGWKVARRNWTVRATTTMAVHTDIMANIVAMVVKIITAWFVVGVALAPGVARPESCSQSSQLRCDANGAATFLVCLGHCESVSIQVYISRTLRKCQHTCVYIYIYIYRYIYIFFLHASYQYRVLCCLSQGLW